MKLKPVLILLIMLTGIMWQTAYSQSNSLPFLPDGTSHAITNAVNLIPIASFVDLDTTCFPTWQANDFIAAKIENNELKFNLKIQNTKAIGYQIQIAKLGTGLKITFGIVIIETGILIFK